MSKRVLVVGYDPATIDFSSKFFGDKMLTQDSISAALAVDRARMAAAGEDVAWMWVPYHGDPAIEAERLCLVLTERPAGLVVFGGGLRLNPAATLLFEAMVNAAIRCGAWLGFNTLPTDTAEAVARGRVP